MRFPFEYSSESKVLNVYVDGEIHSSFGLPCEKTESFFIKSEYGCNRLVVCENGAYIIDADCKRHDCIKAGKIEKTGEMIICAPNRLVIKIEGKGELDAVSY